MSDVTHGSGGWQCAECGFRVMAMPKTPNSNLCCCSSCGHMGTNEEFLSESGKIFARRQIRFMKRFARVIVIIAVGLLIAYLLWKQA